MDFISLHTNNDFNSIKVQLRLYSPLRDLALAMKFQFHKGTIKTGFRNDRRYDADIFQFHKGTIKTVCHLRPSWCLHAFQFHKGTIKTKNRFVCYAPYYDFNSIKVQLRPTRQYQSMQML